MFSSKSTRGKWAWALVDLLVVIIGVYIAFLIQSKAAEKKDQKERTKVLSALKYELEEFRIILPGRSGYAYNQVRKWRESEQGEAYVDFSDWIFIEPQYSYQIIKYAVELENADIIDFQLYSLLQKLFVEIKKLEHTEALIMETSSRYLRTNEKLTAGEQLRRHVDNFENFQLFIRFFDSRAEILQRVAEVSELALGTINERLPAEVKKKIEIDFMRSNINIVSNEQEALGIGMKYFPDIPKEEIIKIYREASEKESEE